MDVEPNKIRALWAHSALQAFAELTGQDIQREIDDVVSDLLCNLQHFCTARRLDYEMLASRGHEHFLIEAQGQDGGWG